MGGERQGADTVGQGRIFDTNAFGPSAATASAGGDGTLPVWSSGASQYRLPPSEVLKGVANRFVHSTGYIYLYGSMALASLFTVVLSLMTECPGTLFYAIELVVNTVLVVEVGVRFVAFGRQFWHSTFNILDLFLVFLCTLTLLIIFFSHTCSPYNRSRPGKGGSGSPEESSGRTGKGEELLDSILLILRNGLQLIRLLAVVRRSGRNALSRPRGIDLDPATLDRASGGSGSSNARLGGSGGGRGGAFRSGAAANDFSLDIDLEDDAEATRSRMRDGGDWSAGKAGSREGGGGVARGGVPGERRELMNDYDEDEEL